MRLGDVRLERYGPFEQLDLAFDPAPGRVNLIVAPNGYGKSVIRRSIGEFLFGIETRTPMTFRFGTERMRVLASVVHDGVTSPLVRRKGNGNTLARADGTEVPPDDWRRILGGADETVFQELFGLDTTLLRSGGRDLIQSQGRLGQVLFAAGGGMGRVRELLGDLERQRDELGKANARHRSRPLWNALSTWEQAGADLRKAALRPDGWIALERRAAETARELERLLAEQVDDGRERERLRTISACRPWLVRLQAANQILLDAADAPELDPGFEKRWRDALQAGVTSASAAETAKAEWQAAREHRAGLTFDPAWIAAEADIRPLADLRGLALGAETDLPGVERDLGAERAKRLALRRDLGWDDTVALPAATVVKEAQTRLRQHPKLAADAEAAAGKRTEAERDLADTVAALSGLHADGDIEAVSDLARQLRADGDPAALLEARRRSLREAEAALRTALAAIPDAPLAETALATTAAPSESRLEAAGNTLAQAETALDRARHDHRTRLAAIEAEQRKLASLERTASLPAPDALTDARTQRDALWSRWLAPAAERPDLDVAVALDRAMRAADAVADALIAHGREVAEAAALRDRLAAMAADLDKAADAVATAETAAGAARCALKAIARTAGGNAADMAALRAFLRAREAAVTSREARDAAAAHLADTEATLTALGSRLARSMDTDPPDLSGLAPLLAEAERRIEAERTLSARRQSLTDQAGQRRKLLAAAIAAAAKAEAALTGWSTQWAPLAAALARPADEVLAATSDALTRIEELRGCEQRIAEAERRITDMRAAIAGLATKIARLAALSAELAALPPIEGARAFAVRLQSEVQQATRCADADKRVEQAAARRDECIAAAEAAARTLAGLRAALRVATDEQAEQQLQRVRAVVAARSDSAEALRHLAEQSGGLSVEALAARAAETTAEADAARVAEIDTLQQARLPMIESAREAAAAAAATLERASSGTEAADAARRREAAQAMLARTAEEALVLHAAHCLLRAALDRQAAGVDQPLLARISTVFQTITQGGQAGVRIEDTRDGQTMVALEADGVTRKSLDQLSEGTCDQLYLALRIAALEDYAKTAPPLPFIADDVLQTFDDPRTTATLRALLDLSASVQVIVLTHHPHVGDLAGRLGDGAVQVLRLDA